MVFINCESGFVGAYPRRVAWEDPLWDGEGCHASGNRCCKYWKDISDILTDQLEIWVM